MSPAKKSEPPARRSGLTPAEQLYVDEGELLDLGAASWLSGWTKQELVTQPIAWVAAGRGQALFCLSSLLAVMALRAAPNWVRPRTGPAVQLCEVCGRKRGPRELLLIDGTQICGDCGRLATRNREISRLENTGSSDAFDSRDAPGSTIGLGVPPPHPSSEPSASPDVEFPGRAA